MVDHDARDLAARAAAVAMAAHGGDPTAAFAALGGEDPNLRALALGALARTGQLTEAHLVAALRDADPRVRRRACELGPAFGVDVSPLLADSDPVVAEAAAFACGEQPDLSAAAWNLLIEHASRATHALVREAAVAALGSRQDARALPAILAALRDTVAVRRRAVIALAPFEGPEVNAALERAANDRDWQVRNVAVDLLAIKAG